MVTIILFLVILSILVLVHEYGHFATARKCGMKVFEFGLGFPPRAFGFYRDPKTKKWVFVRGKGKESMQATVGGEERQEEYPSTLYSVNWLPIGGFVKIKGENGESSADTDSFASHPAWQRFVVLVAGVVMNVLLAALLLGVGFMIGLPTDVTGGVPNGATLKGEPQVVVEEVVPDSPADKAGIRFGDAILAIDGERVVSPETVTGYVKTHASAPDGSMRQMQVTILREQKEETILVVPAKIKEQDETPRLGIALAEVGVVVYPWYVAIGKGFTAAWFGLVNIFVTFYLLIKNLILGQGLSFQVAGPVGIASVVGQSARLGMNYLINITAMISLSLAAMNILPIPALDGGRAFFVILEKILGKKVPAQYEQLAHAIGFVLLMILVLVVTGRDIIRLIR